MTDPQYKSIWIDIPKGIDPASVDVGVIHDALVIAGIGLDGVSRQDSRIRIDCLGDPATALNWLDWSTTVMPPPVDPVEAARTELQAQIDQLKDQIAAAVPSLADIAVSVDAAPIAVKL